LLIGPPGRTSTRMKASLAKRTRDHATASGCWTFSAAAQTWLFGTKGVGELAAAVGFESIVLEGQ
jgi:hypothetical protein